MLTIRVEAKADQPRVCDIHAAAFQRRNEADLVELLRTSAQPHLSLVAEDEGRILGHVFFSPVEIESSPKSLRVAGLAPVAVDPAHQGLGIGTALIRSGLEACPGLGWEAVFLVGNPRYYSRFGFALAATMGFTYRCPSFDPVLQARELRAGALGGHSGRILFHPAFAETGCD